MDRAKKEALVAELHETFETVSLVVLTHQTGLTVKEVSDLRAKMREQGAGYKVTKNTLAKIALEGTKFEYLKDQFTGPTAVAFSVDPIAAAKVAAEFEKTAKEKFTIVAGGLDEKAIDAAGVKNLASLPSLDELRGKIVGLLQAPAGKVVGTLAAPGAQLARVFGAYAATAE